MDNTAIIVAGAALLALTKVGVSMSNKALTVDQVRAIASRILTAHSLRPSEDMIVRIAFVESSFRPSVTRYEPHIDDESIGLMQTLVRTAQWLAQDMGYKAYGVPTRDDLFDPERSIYFGAAFLDWLMKKDRALEWTVRSYNGGPGHSRKATDNYWRKYLKAKERFG